MAEAYGVSDAAGAIGDGGILAKWGLYPTVGLATAILLSKEIYMITEETLYVASFSSIIGAAYLFFGDAVRDALNSEAANIRQ